MPLQRVGRSHPDRLELFRFIGHRQLALGHAGHQERHVEPARQITVGDPVRQQEHRVGSQHQATRCALRSKRRGAVQRRQISHIRPGTIGAAREHHAQFLETLANGGDRLRQVQIALPDAAPRQGMCTGVGRIDATAGKYKSTWRKTRTSRSPGHQDLDTIGAVAQQQDSGGRPQRRWLALAMQELTRSDHGTLCREIASDCRVAHASQRPSDRPVDRA